MSDVDLCNSIREFVASVGLPEGHVPSTKELSEHGRKDLANIVRRRGHKLIKELLANSSETAIEGSDLENNLNDEQNGIYVEETGQEGKVNDMNETSADILLMNDSSTGNSLVTEYESATTSNDQRDRPEELPPLQEKVNDAIEESDDVPLMNASATARFVTESEPAVGLDDQSHTTTKTPVSFQEKVENFMKYGQLDIAEDFCGDLEIVDEKEGATSTSEKNFVECEPVSQSEADTRHLAYVDNNMGLNGTLVASSVAAPDSIRDYLSVQGQAAAYLDKDMTKEAIEMENEDEIDRLKRMLHQKELELFRLKEEIENEKHALLILQTKAENEINKAQKLISEKDAELHAAEEGLSGLVEAKIQYSGEGQMVEVAGSFNGWHQTIKMEPQPSYDTLEPIGSRKSRLWSSTLWLYPGVYEIKFIVDGEWKIDPQTESTIKGGIENNILRVET